LRDSDPQVRYLIGYLFENMFELSKQLDTSASVLLSMSDALSSQSQLNEAVARDIRNIGGHRKLDEQVQSVQIDPNEEG